jgi:hypothetical protein
MDSTFPQDLLDLKIRVDHWRTTLASFVKLYQLSFAKLLLNVSHAIRSDLSKRLSTLILIVSG